MSVLVLLLAVAVPVMHSLTPPPTAMAGSVTMGAGARHHGMSDGAASAMAMDRCDTHPCAVARTDSTPQTAPAFALAVPAVTTPPQLVTGPGARASERAPPREGSASRLCIWRT